MPTKIVPKRGQPRVFDTKGRQADNAATDLIRGRDRADALRAPVDVLLLTVPQAARMLQVGERTVSNLISDGRLPSIKIGGLRRIEYDTLKALLSTATRI